MTIYFERCIHMRLVELSFEMARITYASKVVENHYIDLPQKCHGFAMDPPGTRQGRQKDPPSWTRHGPAKATKDPPPSWTRHGPATRTPFWGPQPGVRRKGGKQGGHTGVWHTHIGRQERRDGVIIVNAKECGVVQLD